MAGSAATSKEEGGDPEYGGYLMCETRGFAATGMAPIARDPQGYPFGAWQAGEHIGARIYDEPGALVWNEAAVEDIAGAQAFYSAVFGFHFDEIEGMNGYGTFAIDEPPLGGLGGLQPGVLAGWSACFSVAVTDDAVVAVEAGGGKVTMAAQDTPYGRFAAVEDPWDAGFPVRRSSLNFSETARHEGIRGYSNTSCVRLSP